MAVARTQAGLPFTKMIDARAPEMLLSSSLSQQGHMFSDARSLSSFRSDPRFARIFGRMHPADAGVLEKPHLNRSNTFFMGDITPGVLVDALHYIESDRADPILKNGIAAYEDDTAIVRGAFNALAKEVRAPNADFADHVRIVTLEPKDFHRYLSHQLSEGPTPERTDNGGLSFPISSLAIMPHMSRESYIQALVHEMVHQMEAAVYFVRNVGGVAMSPLHNRRNLNSRVPDFHLLKTGVQTALIDNYNNVHLAFSGFNEGLAQLITNEMLIKLAPQLGIEAHDLVYPEGRPSWPFHVMLIEELITQLAGTRSGKKAVYDRALRSYAHGTMEVVEDIGRHFGETAVNRLARVGLDTASLHIFAAGTPELELMMDPLTAAYGTPAIEAGEIVAPTFS